MKNFISVLFGGIALLFMLMYPGYLFAQNFGIKMTDGCLTGMGKDCFNYEPIIGINDYQKVDYTAESIAQDIVLAATSMVGVVLTIVIIYCGLMYIFTARGGKDPSTYRKGLIDAGIGAILVWGAYTIIRLIQYIAKG